jgi:hypothetical protein
MLYGQNTRIFGVQPGGSYNNHCASQVFNIWEKNSTAITTKRDHIITTAFWPHSEPQSHYAPWILFSLSSLVCLEFLAWLSLSL